MKNIFIIPARGGSKRLPNKNILLFNGIPLIEHSINFAKQNCSKQDKIVVSTDSDKIKEIVLKNKINVIDRPKELASDTATTVSALKHVIEQTNEKFDNVVLLQITNPLRPKKLFKDAFKIFSDNNYDSLMTVTRNYDKFGKIIDNKFIPFNYKLGQRSQDLEPLYFENGLLYISKTHLILDNQILGKNNLPYIINHPFANVDIDTLEDFKFAEFILKNHKNE